MADRISPKDCPEHCMHEFVSRARTGARAEDRKVCCVCGLVDEKDLAWTAQKGVLS